MSLLMELGPLQLVRFLLAGGAGALFGYWLIARKAVVAKQRRLKHGPSGAKQAGAPALDLRRKAAIAGARVCDHAGECVVVSARAFDMDKTIFQSLEGFIPRTVMRAQIGVELFWEERAAGNIAAQFATIPRPPPPATDIIEFMERDCNFAMEHADGSFMDHLQFCYEYSAAHYKGHSARVLFLHSIMGVGTNFFPMKMEKLPKLAALVTDDELRHIEAFPSVLRLINSYALIEELAANAHRLDELQNMTYHRVMDNATLTLSATDLWVQLNYQLIHLLDFLPATNWGLTQSQPLFQVFTTLHDFMKTTGKIDCAVDCDMSAVEPGADGLPVTLGGLISNAVPSFVKKKISTKAIKKFSAKINHSLDYTLNWKLN